MTMRGTCSMTLQTGGTAAELPCHRCGYDLRAHPADGICPECEASVAESRRLAAIPRRPAWRNSDPRWRRRMLAGAWILVLLPLQNLLLFSGWASRISVPAVFELPGVTRTLDETTFSLQDLYLRLTFCIGVVLLFSKERGPRPAKLDWTRRWGVICSYVVLLLGTAGLLFIGALVLTGIGALFLSIPLKYQPGSTGFFVHAGSGYLLYGPYPHDSAGIVLVAFSSIAILLVCIRLFDALGSSGGRRVAPYLLAPLVVFALMHVSQVARYFVGMSSWTPADVSYYGVYFCPEALVRPLAVFSAGLGISGSAIWDFWVEAAKWCIMLVIAVWLSVAQVAAWWQVKHARPA